MITANRVGTERDIWGVVQFLRIVGMPVLDLGCGDAPQTKFMAGVHLVDLIPRSTPRVHVKDIRKPKELFPGVQFGTTYLLDVIEHLHKEEGLSVLSDLEEITRRIVVFTPLGELWVTPEEDHPHKHRSGWIPEELETLGYSTWVWPDFHAFPTGEKAGAFLAWKDIGKPNVDIREAVRQLGVPFA